jgi:hypothetical protein
MKEPDMAHLEKTVYGLAPDVFLVPVPDGTARLLNMGGRFYALSGVGAAMLRATLDHGPAVAVQQVAAGYGTDPRRVRSDLDRFLRTLQNAGLVHLADKRPANCRSPRGSLLLMVVLGCLYRFLQSVRARASGLMTLAYVSCRLFGWTQTLAAWQRYHDTWPPIAGRGRPTDAAAIEKSVRAAAAGHVLAVECKERALAAWSLARTIGLPASLVIGVHFFPLAGHCWCQSGVRVLSDEPERCEAYQPVVRYN